MQWWRALSTAVLIVAVFGLGWAVGLHWPVGTAQAQQGNITEYRLPNGVYCYTFGGGPGFSCLNGAGISPAGQP
jgi:hypothetical protein